MKKKITLVTSLLISMGSIMTGCNLVETPLTKTVSINDVEDISNEHFDSIDIEVETVKVNLIPVKSAEEQKVELIGDGQKGIEKDLKVKEMGNTLYISLKSKDIISLGYKNLDLDLNIYVEEKKYDEIDFKGSVSKLLVKDLSVNEINSDLNTGKIKMDNVETNKIIAHVNTGDIDLNDFKGAINATTNTGDVLIFTKKITDSISAKVNVGNINIETEEKPNNVEINAKTNVGKVKLYDKRVKNLVIGDGEIEMKLKTQTGSIIVN